MPSIRRSNNLASRAIAVVLSVVALCVPIANSFAVVVVETSNSNFNSNSHPNPCTTNNAERFRSTTTSTTTTTALWVSEFSSAETEGDPLNDSVSPSVSIDRRSVLLGGASVTAGWFLHANNNNNNNNNLIDNRLPKATLVTTALEEEDQPSAPGSIVVAPTTTTVSSVEEALTIIESIGDKRFLHAVVASDYQFLYEQSSDIDSDMDVEAIFSRTDASASASAAAAASSSSPRWIRSIVPAVTGSLAPPRAPSLWPLEKPSCAAAAASSSDSCGRNNGIHYAWPSKGGMFPTATAPAPATAMANSNTNTKTDTNAVIVDGIDCGKMSLEDALEGDTQVLVQAPTYLVVPAHMESNLRKGLRDAFLI